MSTYIVTHSGLKFNPFEPEKQEINIIDIAHALANICRYTGHSRFHYSVAQHSVYVSQMVPEHLQMAALLHDASEAYLNDISRPLKILPAFEKYREVEYSLQRAIYRRFDVGYSEPPSEVKVADGNMFWIEFAQIMPHVDISDGTGPELEDRLKDLPQIEIEPLAPYEAEEMFIRYFYLYQMVPQKAPQGENYI